MKRNMWVPVIMLSLCLFGAANVQALEDERFDVKVGPVTVQPVGRMDPLKVPFITWGGDMATFYANGGLTTQPGSIFGKLGLNISLQPGDDFHQQVRDYMEGRSPFLRGTFRMIGMASEVIGSDSRTQGVVFLQMTWSSGDHMVGRDTIRSGTDLKGKTVVLQSGGPHVGLLDDILRNSGLQWDDIKVIWAKDLTATPDSPAEMFRKNPQIDACLVITPDMIGLCGGIDKKGTGAEGTVKGAWVVQSTTQLSRSIADVYACRSDFFNENKDLVTKFVAGYLKACEDVGRLRNKFEGKSISEADKATYMNLLKMSQDIYTKKVMPTLEEDAHGLLMDCTFVGYPGNWKFFTWGLGNTVGFERLNEKALELAIKRGFVRTHKNLILGKLDYDSKYFAMLQDKTKPEFIQAESSTVTPVGQEILEFAIEFMPDQMEFSARQYEKEFQRAIEMSAQYAACAIVIKGHADPTLTLSTMVKAGLELGILKKSASDYSLDGRPLDITQTPKLIKLIEEGKFEGARQAGSPKQIVTAAQVLSEKRAQALKDSLMKYAKDRGTLINMSQFMAQGMGISEPLIPTPRNTDDMAKNRRVVFSLVPVQAEAKSDTPFNY